MDKLKNKENIILCTIFFITIISLVCNFFVASFNVDSLYDEGFLLLELQDANNNLVNGSTQWNLIITKLLGNSVSNDYLSLRYLKIIFSFISVILFSTLSLLYLRIKGCNSNKKYFIIISLLFVSISTGGVILNYNGLQQLYMLVTLPLFLLSIELKNNYKYLTAFLFGFIYLFSLFTILPGAICVLCGYFILYIIKCINNRKVDLKILLFVSLGILTAILFFNYKICSIKTIIETMIETATTITTLNRGYDPISFFLNAFFFIRDFVFCILIIVGGWTISTNMKNKFNLKIAHYLLFSILIIFYFIYQEKPRVTISMLSVFIIIIPWYNITDSSSYRIKNIFSFDNLLLLFLFIFPIFASIGTNVYLGQKIAQFIVVWALLIIILFNKIKFVPDKSFLLVLLTILLIFPQIKYIYNTYKTDTYKFTKTGSLSKMNINKSQYDYYNKVYGILTKYNYKTNKSVILSTQLDHMTIFAMSAISCGNFFQPTDFLASDKSKLKIPDFIFLTDYDKEIIGKSLSSLDWGWPNNFDEYFIGTPEVFDTGYSTNRYLYCRKK